MEISGTINAGCEVVSLVNRREMQWLVVNYSISPQEFENIFTDQCNGSNNSSEEL